MIKRIENIFYSFIWGNGSEKVRREDSKLPVNMGGLGMPDVSRFWTAFKFSWFRRLLSTKAFWPKLLLQEVSIIRQKNTTGSDLLQLGTSNLNKLSKSIKNPFWKQVFVSAVPIAEGSMFCNPEKFLDTSFWFNPFVKRANVIKYNDFPELANKIITLGDFFIPGTKTFMSYENFCHRYTCNISREKYIDIRFTINLALQKLKLPEIRLNMVNLPQRPILIDIAMSVKKGCSFYSRLLTKKSTLNNKISLRENKWHTELGLNFSLGFWENARRLCSKIDFDNQLKWLQYQIVRNSLQTNAIVSHFIPNVQKACTYCQNPDSTELISHLFWSCIRISDFLNDVFTFISSTGLPFEPSKEQFLFGFSNTEMHHPKNYISLVVKKYIWRTKFKTKQVTMNGFKALMKSYICDLKFMFTFKNKPDLFNEWIPIDNAL